MWHDYEFFEKKKLQGNCFWFVRNFALTDIRQILPQTDIKSLQVDVNENCCKLKCDFCQKGENTLIKQ